MFPQPLCLSPSTVPQVKPRCEVRSCPHNQGMPKDPASEAKLYQLWVHQAWHLHAFSPLQRPWHCVIPVSQWGCLVLVRLNHLFRLHSWLEAKADGNNSLRLNVNQVMKTWSLRPSQKSNRTFLGYHKVIILTTYFQKGRGNGSCHRALMRYHTPTWTTHPRSVSCCLIIIFISQKRKLSYQKWKAAQGVAGRYRPWGMLGRTLALKLESQGSNHSLVHSYAVQSPNFKTLGRSSGPCWSHNPRVQVHSGSTGSLTSSFYKGLGSKRTPQAWRVPEVSFFGISTMPRAVGSMVVAQTQTPLKENV